MHLSALLVALTCVSTASAHVALWDKGMFGLNYPYQSDDPSNNNYNNNEPVIPLKQVDARSTAGWFGHGLLSFPPKSGDFMVLPSGGTYNGEVSCNRGQTTLGDPNDKTAKYQYACRPDGGQYSGVGALHVMNAYNGTVDNKWFGGSALAIAYTSDVNSIKPNDLTVISVKQNSVWERQISYQIPAGLPPCPAGGCLCTWNWIHQGGHGEGYPNEIYNVMYRCQVTGNTNSANVVQKGAIPNKCDGNPSACVKGPKVPMYLWQADGNNLPDLDTPPNYKDNWGYADGAQNDVFKPAATPASSTPPKATATALPSGWKALGCMTDSTTTRALPGVSSSDANNNTIQGCVASCASKGYLFAGVEYGQECWCSNTATLTAAASTECNMVCPGDIWSNCGAGGRINVFASSNAPTSGEPTTVPASSLPSGWSDLGCIVDDQSNRALNGGSSTSSNNTVQSCIAKCSAQGFAYAGVEYGQECWCGSTARLTAASSGCNVACSGDPSYVCGGSNRLNVYSSKSSTSSISASASRSTVASTSTISSKVSTSTSSSKAATSSSSSKAVVTSSSSSKAAVSSSSSKAVVSSSSKAVVLSSSSKPATSTSTSKVVSTTPLAAPTSAKTSTTTTKVTSTTSIKPSTTTTSTTTIKTSTSTSAAPAATTSLPAGWVSRGCYVDSSSARVLTGSMDSKTDMTYAQCIAICTKKNMPYAGLEYGKQCLCGTSMVSPTSATGCTTPCAGDASAMCGGFNRITILQQTSTVKSRREWNGERGQPPY
ncbi:uncharacterized protein IL334_005260 [Kwoniella shivajii]|uniref:WSC domain-containing protein n=1 Tax=Kwoniella shivajii TaxID=564305 RepID=A0ABZ1D4M3_9TREE|nr:hypothetical protein IL334_005260 [Kwoniella shivajii]